MLQKLILSTLGIYFAYLSHSIISQKLYGGYQYPHKSSQSKDLFLYPSLVFIVASLFCSIFGFLKGIYLRQPINPISLKQQLTLGLYYTMNYLTAHYCLLFISYPTQSIGRNLRFLTVIIIGVFFSKVPKNNHQENKLSIGKDKLWIGTIITIGVVCFNLMKFMNEQSDEKDSQNAWIGYILLFISLFCDAFFNDNQAYTKITFKPTSNHLYTCTNFFGFIFTLIFSIFRGTLLPSIQFILTHQQVLFDIIIMVILQLIGQNCIYYIVSNFKQHIFPLIAITRKLFTVLLSIYIYNHPINIYQWISLGLVFVAVFYQAKVESEEKTKSVLEEVKNKDIKNQ